MSAIDDRNYFNLVKDTLIGQWSLTGQPIPAKQDDLTAGITLLTRIAIEAINVDDPESRAISSLSEVTLGTATDRKVKRARRHPTSSANSSDAGATEQVADKIKKFVREKSYLFGNDDRIICDDSLDLDSDLDSGT